MTLLQVIVLAIIQGITEFLPVSSSGHLALVPVLAGWPDQGLVMDVAVHVGTLGAVIVYLRRDILKICLGLLRLTRGETDDGARLAGLVLISGLPVFAAGFLLSKFVGGALREPAIIGWAFVIFGIVLFISDRIGEEKRTVSDLKVADAFIIGFGQACALIPGASRAGTTITMARFLGIDRREAARFSMLMSIPAIVGAGTLLGIDVIKSGDSVFQTWVITATALAFFAALIAIYAMMGWLRRQNYTPFVIYRILLGVVILLFAGQM